MKRIDAKPDSLCDFCNSKPTVVGFELKPEIILIPAGLATVAMDDDGKWDVCSNCECLILEGNKDGLMLRMINKYLAEAGSGATAEEAANAASKELVGSFFERAGLDAPE